VSAEALSELIEDVARLRKERDDYRDALSALQRAETYYRYMREHAQKDSIEARWADGRLISRSRMARALLEKWGGHWVSSPTKIKTDGP
jgi:hypothetical protein